MTPWTLIRRSLRFHRRAHLGVVLGAAVGSAALIGALIVGDSVKETLRDRALARLQNIAYALQTGDRFFVKDLRERLGDKRAPGSIQAGAAVFNYSSLASGVRSVALMF